MALEIPSLEELEQKTIDDFKTQMGITNSLGKVFLLPLTKVIAAEQKTLYYSIANVQKNVFPDTCDLATLDRYSRVRLGRGRLPASQGKYSMTVSGDIGTVIDAGTTWKKPNDNTLYRVDIETTLPDPVQIRCLEAGTEFQLFNGDILEPTEPILTVTTGDIIDTVDIPIDAETDELWRERVVNSFTAEANGGANSDYRIWGADVNQLRRVWVYVEDGNAGGLLSYAEALTLPDSPFVPVIPSQDILDLLYEELPVAVGEPAQRVGAYVINPDDSTDARMPVGVKSMVNSGINLVDVYVTIDGLQVVEGQSQQDVIDRINEELLKYAYDIRPFQAGADNLNTAEDTLRAGQLLTAAFSVLASGQTFESLTMESPLATPVDSIKFVFGDVPNLLITINI